MVYFDKDYIVFFKELAANNHKQWFDSNRKRYETVVKKPFKQLISDLIVAVQKIDADLFLESKNAIFRINRDIRFSKDKTPYKLFNSAIISRKGRKDKSCPGMYIEINPEKLIIAGGLYSPDTTQINRVRNHILRHMHVFESLLQAPGFRQSFGVVKGAKNKRIHKNFQNAAHHQELLYNKQWFYEISLPSDTIFNDNLLDIIMEYYKIAHPLQEFFIKALK